MGQNLILDRLSSGEIEVSLPFKLPETPLKSAG